MPVDWIEAQRNAALTARWAVMMVKVRIRRGCIGDTLAASHVYEVRPRKEKRGVDLFSDVLPFGGLLVHKTG